MKLRQHVASAVIRAVITLLIASFLLTLLFSLWDPTAGHHLLTL